MLRVRNRHPVVAKMAHNDGTRVMQYRSDDQKIMKTTNMQMPMDFLEIPEKRLGRMLVFQVKYMGQVSAAW